jgi:hypothetical protein
MLAPTSGFGLCANTSALGFAAHSFAMAMSITDSGSTRIADSSMLRWTTYCLTSLPPCAGGKVRFSGTLVNEK